MNVGDYIDGPYQGVSQAPPQVRLAQQAEALEDTYVGIPQGAIKRPPLTFLGQLAGHPGHTDGTCELFLGNDGNYYLITITLEAGVAVPRVYDVNNPSVAIPIVISAGAQAYLSNGIVTPSADLLAVTVEDNTFILNRKQAITTLGTSPSRPFEALIFVKLAAYAKGYRVTVYPIGGGAAVGSYLETPNGKDSTDGNYVATDVIADVLYEHSAYSAVNGAAVTGTPLNALTSQGFTVQCSGPVIYISHPTVDFTIVTTDDQGGTAMQAIKTSVQDFADLPQKAVPGFTVKIAQQSGNANDDFYVQYVPTAGSDTGVWQECIQPGVSLGFNPAQLPVSLTHPSNWQINTPAWKQRDVGNPTLIPDPDFVGRTITDISWWQGRLALVSSEAVTLSASDDPFRLYPRTVTTELDDDPLALISPVPGKSTFSFTANFDQRLVVFGDVSQAAVQSNGPPTANTASMLNVCAYAYAGKVRPQVSNGNVYFVAPRGNVYSTIYELKSSRNSNGDYTLLGEDLTAAVPRYVPAALDRVANCPVNYLIVYGSSGDSALYPHLFRYAEGQRVQNAWERWNFQGFTLGGLACHNTNLYVLLCVGASAYLCVMDLSPDVLDEGSARLLTHLDLRVMEAFVTFSYDGTLDRTTVTLPYAVPEGRTLVASVRAPGGVAGTAAVVAQGGTVPEGFQADVLSVAGNVAVLAGKWNGAPMWFGLQYASRYRLSTIYALDRKGSPFRSNRMALQRLKVDLSETGYLRAEITPDGRDMNTVEYTGYIVDDPGSALDQAPFAETGTLSVPVFTNTERVTIDLVNDSIFQSKILGFEWLGKLTQKTTRLNG